MVKPKKKLGTKAAMRALRAEIDGRKYTPPRTPSSIVGIPWNSLVVSRLDKSLTDILKPTVTQAQDIYLYALQHMGADKAAFPMEFRLSKVEVWNMGSSASLIVDVFPLTTYTQLASCIARLEDEPGKNNWACAGYEWPRSHKNFVYQFNGLDLPLGNPIITKVFSNVGGSPIWTRFHMLWRYQTEVPPRLAQELLANMSLD